MLNFKNSEFLNGLIIQTVYDYYDMPIVFSCKNNLDWNFLVICINELNEEFVWVYLPVTINRLLELEAHQIKLRDAILTPEDGWIFLITENVELETVNIKSILPTELDVSLLPNPNKYLTLTPIVNDVMNNED